MISLIMRLSTILILLLLTSNDSNAQVVRVMSYNIRYDTKADGINQWGNRIEKVTQLIHAYDPDLLGVQEALHDQIIDLQENLTDYEYVGVGRDDGKMNGEYSAIFFKKNKYKVLLQHTFWLSTNPEVPGSKSWDAAITRIVTYAVMKDNSTGQLFVHFNTHFDHLGKEARKKSAELIKSYIAGMKIAGSSINNIPLIISGDFNSEPTEEPYQIMIDGTVMPLLDSRPTNNLTGTYCGFEVNAIKCKTIDYIFHSPHWKAESYQVIQDHDGKNYPSDHLPVLATFSLEK